MAPAIGTREPDCRIASDFAPPAPGRMLQNA